MASLSLLLNGALVAQSSPINMPAGRIAFSSDGNLHDSDDWGATAFSLAMLHYAGLSDRFVHYDYNNHLGKSHKSWEVIMDDAAKGGALRFGLDTSCVFNDQYQKEDAIANFVKEASKSTKKNPLWFICAGPMHMAYEMIAATPEENRPYIYTISHGTWNEVHVHGECQKTWKDMKLDFATVQYFDIVDQNKSNGEDDFQSHISLWSWLKDSDNPNWQWLYGMDDTHWVDDMEHWKSNTKETFDISDAGMTYWLITGGPMGGNDKGGWKEVKALFENPQTNFESKKVYKPKAYNANAWKSHVLEIEAESTKSDLAEWLVIKEGDSNYVADASGEKHIEFLGNTEQSGDPNSPLEYTFKVKEDGNYRLLMLSSKRLEGARGDMCNDVWVKMSGDFQSACKLSKTDMEDYLKYFQDGSTKTPEMSWNWAVRSEKGSHKFHKLIYTLKKGETYTLTIAGRSKRFSVDYILFYNTDNAQAVQSVESIVFPKGLLDR